MNEHEGPEEPVGSLGEETAKLMDALAGWAREQGHDLGEGASGLAGAAAQAAHQVDQHLATGAEECRYCPVCRVVHVLRGTSPEVKMHLASAAQSLLQAASGVLATVAPAEDGGRGVQHIDVDGEADDAEWEDGEWEDETP